MDDVPIKPATKWSYSSLEQCPIIPMPYSDTFMFLSTEVAKEACNSQAGPMKDT